MIHQARMKDNVFQINNVLLNNIDKITDIFPFEQFLNIFNSHIHGIYNCGRNKCRSSLLSLCRMKHPGQLLAREMNIIRAYCADPRYLLWPLSSVYHRLFLPSPWPNFRC